MNKILIVDNIRNVEIMRKILTNDTCEIFTAQTGYSALAKINMFHPDLVIMEMELPDSNGCSICEKIKQDSDIIVLLLSSSNSKQEKVKAFEAGADDFLEKNFDSFILLSKVKSLLRIKYLREQLQKKYSELEEMNNVLAMQLEMAQRLQLSLIPELNTKFGQITVRSKYLPAMYIGGDFYDVINLNENCLCVILGDVSGHGISAALLTAMLNNMIKNIVGKCDIKFPNEILSALNHEFISTINSNEIYACVSIAIIDTQEKKIFYSNAGQSSPIFISNGNAQEIILNGTPIGLINNSAYENKILDYESGDKIFFHTDGLENNLYKKNPDDFTRDLIKILNETDDADELIQNVLYQFCSSCDVNKYDNDDVSIILCQI